MTHFTHNNYTFLSTFLTGRPYLRYAADYLPGSSRNKTSIGCCETLHMPKEEGPFFLEGASFSYLCNMQEERSVFIQLVQCNIKFQYVHKG